ncbi:hypothetical protein [Rhodovulum adriaticum]|uniref:Uncharacterized protein n=1 Tax=Rhodovulum adriaticum TaxID=35804 RepID=A0A4R2NV87_RHOAD|nr:hypothetical protein [Rhodovulum adriaticum]MBK1636183.1 hypothetical protein [Rhodovulum adriaticum]TCP25501.1 hypothetical protein EV656_103254 [Rhodovulum adriaticum]
MSDCPSSVQATLLFAEWQELDLADLISEFSRTLRNIGLDCPSVEARSNPPRITLSNDRISVCVSLGESQISAETLRGVQRPTLPRSSDNAVQQILQVCDSAIHVEAAHVQNTARPVARRILIAACYHVVRFLDHEFEADLIHWHPTDMLFTAEEFETPIMPPDSADTPARPVLPESLAAAEAMQGATAEVAPEMASMRLEAEDAEVIDTAAEQAEIARSEAAPDVIDADASAETTGESNWENNREFDGAMAARQALAQEEALRKARRSIFADDLIETEDRQREQPKEPVGLIEQTTVYVMTSTLMIVSFPIGFAVLIYNILAGENLRNTARAMALTGVGFAFSTADLAAGLSSLI